jgi:hypothetical protein
MPTIWSMFDCEAPTLEEIPAPLRPRPGAVSDIPIEDEEEATGGAEGAAYAGEGTVRRLAEVVPAVGTVGCVLSVPGAVRGLLFLLAAGVTAADAVLIYRWR